MTKIQKLFLIGCVSVLGLSLAVKYLKVGNALANPVPVEHATFDAIGIHLTDINVLPVSQADTLRRSAIDQARAIQVADPYAGPGIKQAGSVGGGLYLFTNSQYGPVDKSGQVIPNFQNRLVWLITYRGIFPALGGRGMTLAPPNTEYNVVIDAVTGEFLQAFTYK